jgi:apolipoprotein D and lipocalin family protein
MSRHTPRQLPSFDELRSRLDHAHLPASAGRTGSAVAVAVSAGAIAYLAWMALRTPPRPASVQPVGNFDISRYLGRWYEVARIDQRFEKGLVRTRAEYSLGSNGSVQVVNRGFDPRRNRWQEARGKAQFVGSSDEAALKVSFFGPFYGGYNVVALDEQYRWAMVIGSSLDDFWILSRTPVLPGGVRQHLLAQAQQIGVDLDRILWVMQDGANPTGS